TVPASLCTAIRLLISVTPAGNRGSCICGMGSLLPQRRLLGNTFRDHSIFIERQDLRGEIRRSEASPLRRDSTCDAELINRPRPPVKTAPTFAAILCRPGQIRPTSDRREQL